MVLNVPFSPRNRPRVTGHFCGRVLGESTDRGNPAIVIWKFWVALAPVGDRLTRYQDAVKKPLPGLGTGGVAVLVPAQRALTRLQPLYDRPVRHRMLNLLLVGPANNGKSMVVEKFRRLLFLPSPWARLAD